MLVTRNLWIFIFQVEIRITSELDARNVATVSL